MQVRLWVGGIGYCGIVWALFVGFMQDSCSLLPWLELASAAALLFYRLGDIQNKSRLRGTKRHFQKTSDLNNKIFSYETDCRKI